MKVGQSDKWGEHGRCLSLVNAGSLDCVRLRLSSLGMTGLGWFVDFVALHANSRSFGAKNAPQDDRGVG